MAFYTHTYSIIYYNPNNLENLLLYILQITIYTCRFLCLKYTICLQELREEIQTQLPSFTLMAKEMLANCLLAVSPGLRAVQCIKESKYLIPFTCLASRSL